MELLIQKAQKCLELIKEAGVDKGYCSVNSTVKHEFNVDGGEFSLFRTLFDHKLSITVYNKGKKGTISINKYDDDSIKEAVADCIASSESAKPDDAWNIAPVSLNEDFTEGSPDIDTNKLFDRTEELLKTVKLSHPKILMEQMIVQHIRYESVYANTNGVQYTTLGGEYGVDLMFSGHDDDATSSFFGSGIYTDNLDTPFIELGSIEKDLTDVENQIYTKSIEGKFVGTVICTPDSLGSLLGSALNNFAGDMTLLDGTSIWKDKLNTAVASPSLTVSMNPLDSRIVCGERYTSEGYRSEAYDVIKDGILKSFMISEYVSNKTGKERAKNTSGNMIITPGEKTYDEIIKNTEKGIIVGRISGGEPSANGEFSCVAKNSFYVEKGEIKYAVSETMISGNLADLLMNVKDISKETVCDGNSVRPYIAFDGITISGK